MIAVHATCKIWLICVNVNLRVYVILMAVYNITHVLR